MADKKHWLDWLAVGISILSLTVATLPAYRTVLYQRDDIRLIVGDSLKVKRDKSGLLLSRDQEFTFINSGNRQAVISEIWCWSSIRMQDAITSSQNPSFSIQQPKSC